MITFFGNKLFSRRGCLFFIGSYLLILFALRITLFPGSSEDDAEQLFFSQILSWGYKVNQPPLYTWLVILAQKVFGVSAASIAVIKFASLFAIYIFTYSTATLIFRDDRFRALAALSLFAIFYINWDAVVNYSHTVLMAAFLMATLYAFLKIDSNRSIGSYIILGALMGLGLLSKYNFALFLIPLLIAATLTPSFRTKTTSAKFLISLLIAGAIIAPHIQWLLASPTSISTTPEYLDVASGAGSVVLRSGKGLLDAAAGALLFLAPLWLFYLLFFWRSFKPISASNMPEQDYRRFFEIYFAAFAIIVIGGIVAFTLSGIRNHWMMVLIPFPIYFLLRIQSISPRTVVLERFAVFLASFAVIVAVALFSRAMTAPNYCKKCNFFFPYAELSEQIKSAGFESGTLITYGIPNQLGGNLRRYFPDTRIISNRYAYFVPPDTNKGKCLLIWNESSWAHGSRARTESIAQKILGFKVPAHIPSHSIAAPLTRSKKNKTAKLGFLILEACG
jgi:4-amino-4-deoxy-L-arabinose transferase-like glycosyltransferase